MKVKILTGWATAPEEFEKEIEHFCKEKNVVNIDYRVLQRTGEGDKLIAFIEYESE